MSFCLRVICPLAISFSPLNAEQLKHTTFGVGVLLFFRDEVRQGEGDVSKAECPLMRS